MQDDRSDESDIESDLSVEILTLREKCTKYGRYLLLCKCLIGANMANYFELTHHAMVMG